MATGVDWGTNLVSVRSVVDVYLWVIVVVEVTSPVTVMVVGGRLGPGGVTTGWDLVPLGSTPGVTTG